MFLKRSLMIAFSVLIALFIIACGNTTMSGGGSYGGGSSRKGHKAKNDTDRQY